MGWALLLAAEVQKEGKFTDLKVSTAVWAWVAFLVTFAILNKVAWPGRWSTRSPAVDGPSKGQRTTDERLARRRLRLRQGPLRHRDRGAGRGSGLRRPARRPVGDLRARPAAAGVLPDAAGPPGRQAA